MIEYVFSLSGAAWLITTGLLVCWGFFTKCLLQNKLRDRSWTIGMIVFSSLYTFLAADLVVATTVIESNGNGGTLAHQRWMRKYWVPTLNSYGYRDIEPQLKARTLMMLGASFVEGGGIERLEDTMTGVLRRKLGSNWSVVSVAKSGWDTRLQLEGLVNYPRMPNIIVVSYTPFDIHGRAAEHGLSPLDSMPSPPSFAAPLIQHSPLANWLYWRFRAGGLAYWSRIMLAHQTPAVFESHVSDLRLIIRHAREINSRIYFVLWPAAYDLDNSDKILMKIDGRLTANGAETIHLLPYWRNMQYKESIVSAANAHPSAKVHHMVAELIFERLSKDGLIGPATNEMHQTVRSSRVRANHEKVE